MNKQIKSQRPSDEFMHRRIQPGSELDKRLTREQLIIGELYDQVRKGYMDIAEFRRLLKVATRGAEPVAA